MNKIFRNIILIIALIIIGCCPAKVENNEIPEMHSIYLRSSGSRLDYWTINIDNQIYRVFRSPDGRYTVIEIKTENNNNNNLFNW